MPSVPDAQAPRPSSIRRSAAQPQLRPHEVQADRPAPRVVPRAAEWRGRVADGLIDPLVSLDEAADAYMAMSERPATGVKMGVRF